MNHSNNKDLTPKRLTTLLKVCLEARLVPMITSSPGLGKSSIVKQLADELNLAVIDVRLAQCDVTDLFGFPTLNEARTRSHYAPPSTFPIETDALPEGKAGWVLFLDELSSAPKAVQAAAYKIVLDRQVGAYDLHPNVHIIAAGNGINDGAVVTKTGTAMQSRLVHFGLRVSTEDWAEWALQAGIDHRVMSYIKFAPNKLHSFNPDHTDSTFPCPRTWEFVSNAVSKFPSIGEDIMPLIEGCVGPGASLEFQAYTEIYHKLPTREQILADPKGVVLPNDPSTNFALSGLIVDMMELDTVPVMFQFLERIPVEFQLTCISSLMKAKPTMLHSTEATQWIDKNTHLLG